MFVCDDSNTLAGRDIQEETVRPSDLTQKQRAGAGGGGIRNMCLLNSSDSDSSGGTDSQVRTLNKYTLQDLVHTDPSRSC